MKNQVNHSKKCAMGTVMTVILLALSSTAVFAAEDSKETASYGYLAGQQKSSERHGQYQSMAGLSTDDEREAYYESHGIGGGIYSDMQHPDGKKLVEAGVISQETADKITAYASGKHDELHGWYDGGMDGITAEQRHELFDGLTDHGYSGGSVEELEAGGILTQEEAQAIYAYLSSADR